MKISVQLYSVRDQMGKDPAGTLKAVAKTGLHYVETAGYAGKSVEEFAQMVKDAGITFSGMHAGFEAAENNLDGLLHEAKVLNCPYIIVPGLPGSLIQEGWDHAGIRLQAIGEKVAKAKRSFAYHNHNHEFVDVKGRTGYDILFESACPDFVKNQIDLWWAYVGNQDVPKLLDKYGKRVKLVHLKDGKSRDGAQAVAGDGAMDWDPILKACDRCKVDFGSIEFDEAPGDPIECIAQSLAFFRKKGYKQ